MNFIVGSTCTTLMYAPNNDVVTLLVTRVAQRNNIPSEEIVGFDSEYAMDDFILDHINRTQAGYL